jgi:hypothetical protein
LNSNLTPNFAYQKNAPNTGASLEKNMESVIENFKPTIIIYPYSNDEHPDHWGTNAFVEYACNKLNYTGQRYSYPVHISETWPFPQAYTNLLPASFMLSILNQSKWLVFPIDNSNEKLKSNAINTYKSQLANPSYLRSFVRNYELFATYEQGTISKRNVSINYIDGQEFPPTIFQDPKGDTLVKPPFYTFYSILNLKLMDDIKDVGFDVDNNTLWMSVKTDGGISKNSIYHFGIRSFGNGNVNRVDVNVTNGTATYEIPSSNSKYSKVPLKVIVKDNGIIIGIPYNLFDNDKKFMISVDDTRNNQYIDRTGWYTINVI